MESMSLGPIPFFVVVSVFVGGPEAFADGIDPAQLPPRAVGKIEFRQQILPLLKERCFGGCRFLEPYLHLIL